MAQLPTESRGRKCPEQRPESSKEPPPPPHGETVCGPGAPLEAQGRRLRSPPSHPQPNPHPRSAVLFSFPKVCCGFEGGFFHLSGALCRVLRRSPEGKDPNGGQERR